MFCYTTLLIYVGTKDAVRGDLEQIKNDYMVLGARVKGVRAQVVFLLILPLKGKALARSRHILEIKMWLHRWCCWHVIGFFDHRVIFQENRLLGKKMV